MFSRVNKFILITFLFSYSCNKESEVRRKTSLCKDISLKASGKMEYDEVYEKALDSLRIFQKNALRSYGFLGIGNWELDSLICFNKDADKCVMSLSYTTSSYPDSDHDGLNFFHCAKIDQKWYFFIGSSFHLSRELYQDDIHTPLSFEKMHEIAMENIFRGYLVKNDQDKWEINNRFFISMANKNAIGTGYGGCPECKTEDEYYFLLSKKNWLSKHTALRADELEALYNERLRSLTLRFPLRPFAKYIMPFKVVTKMYGRTKPNEPVIKYIQSKTNFDETGFIGKMKFEKIDLLDTLTFNIQFYFTCSGNDGAKPLIVKIPVKKVKRVRGE